MFTGAVPDPAGGRGSPAPLRQPAVHRHSTGASHPQPVHEFQVATVSALAAGSLVAAVAAWNRAGAERRFAAFLAICAAFLAFDKATGAVNRLHEGLHHLGFPDPPLVRGIDDLIWLAAMAAAFAFCAWHWRLLLKWRPVTLVLAAGAVFAAIGLALDSRAAEDGIAPRIEDWAELAMSVSILAAGLLLLRGAEIARRTPRAGALSANRSITRP